MLLGQKRLLKDLAVNIVKDFGENFLVVELSDQYKLIPHQLEIIKRNSPSGIMAIEEIRNNNQTKLYYHLQSCLPLSCLLERGEIGSKAIVNILDELMGILLESKNYLLSATGFLLLRQYIYLHPLTYQVTLVYLPVKLPGIFDVHENFRQLLKELSDICADFPQDLIKYSEDDYFFNLQGFRQRLKNMRHPLIIKNKQEKQKEKGFHLDADASSNMLKADCVVKDNLEKTGNVNHADIQIKEAKKFLVVVKKPLIIFFLLQMAVAVVLYLLSTVILSSDASSLTYLGIFLLIMSFDLLLLKKLLQKDSKE